MAAFTGENARWSTEVPAALRAELVSFAETLADAARAEILPFWRKPNLAVESKVESGRPVPESPVTVADRNAETVMRRLIEAKYPAHGVLGEELGAVRQEAELCWVLDPIDGTKSFITGKPLFGTLIGLCHRGVPVLGVLDQCVLKERWVGQVGVGTTLNGEPVRAGPGAASLGDAMLYATTPHMFSPGFETERWSSVRDAVKRALYGSDCYAYALVASGFGADLVVEADLGIYDYAALVPIVLGAGGRMSSWSGEPLTMGNHAACRGRVVAAASEGLHAAAVAILGKPAPGNAVLKPHLRELQPYLPPLDGRSPSKHLLLDFNERTIPVPQHVLDSIPAHMAERGLQCYPAYGDFNLRVAEYAGVPPSQCMFTNGSDQGIDLVVRACCPFGTEAIIPAPTFAMYEQAALTEGLEIRRPFFTLEGGFPLEEVLSMIGPKTSLVVLSNPNNPTGTAIPREAMLAVARAAPHACILIDECYFEFMPKESTMVGDVADLPNVFVTRTFSKTWGLPSLRIGYVISCEANIKALCSVRGPYDINQLSVVAATAALQDSAYVFELVDELNNQAKPAFEAFLQEIGVVFWPTDANFVFCYFVDPPGLEAKLRAKGILVRPKKDADGVTGLRISLGTLAQTERLIAELRVAMRQ